MNGDPGVDLKCEWVDDAGSSGGECCKIWCSWEKPPEAAVKKEEVHKNQLEEKEDFQEGAGEGALRQRKTSRRSSL